MKTTKNKNFTTKNSINDCMGGNSVPKIRTGKRSTTRLLIARDRRLIKPEGGGGGKKVFAGRKSDDGKNSRCIWRLVVHKPTQFTIALFATGQDHRWFIENRHSVRRKFLTPPFGGGEGREGCLTMSCLSTSDKLIESVRGFTAVYPPVTPSRPHSTPCTRSPVPLSFTPPPKKCIYMTVCLLARLNANKWRCMMTMGTVVTVNGFGWDDGRGETGLREMDVGARTRTRERDGKREGRNTQRS